MHQPGRLVNKQITQDTLLESLHHDPANPLQSRQQRQRVIDIAGAKASIRRTHNIDSRHDPRLNDMRLIEEMIERRRGAHGAFSQ